MLSAELKAFFMVARLGSITQAAKKLGLSQPTVTTQIRNLESQYGVELFYRGGRRLTVSDEGARLLPMVKALLQQLYSVKARAEAELNSCIAGAKAEFKSLPESQQTQARKVSIVLARSGRLYAMQASYDREVESIVSQMRAILTANGQSTALADQAMASYKAQKSAMYSRLTAKLYS